jgi:hypothetical protein
VKILPLVGVNIPPQMGEKIPTLEGVFPLKSDTPSYLFFSPPLPLYFLYVAKDKISISE